MRELRPFADLKARPSRPESSGCPRTGSRRRAESARAAAASLRSRSRDASRDRGCRRGRASRCIRAGGGAAHQPDRRVVGRLAQKARRKVSLSRVWATVGATMRGQSGILPDSRPQAAHADARWRPYDARDGSVMIGRSYRMKRRRRPMKTLATLAATALLCCAAARADRARRCRRIGRRLAARRRARTRHAARVHDGRLQAVFVLPRGRPLRGHRHRHGRIAREVARREDRLRERRAGRT